MSNCFSTTIERERRVLNVFGGYDDVFDEITVDVTYDFYRGCKGARDSLCGVRRAGPPLEPDEPPSVEILSVKDKDDEEYELTERELDRVTEECFFDQQSGYDEEQEQRAEGDR